MLDITDLQPVRFVLIESDWNLKYIAINRTPPRLAVLIESDWNLKEIIVRINSGGGDVVLIESDWNLKAVRVQPDICRYWPY